MAFTAAAIRVLLVEPHDDTRELYEMWMTSLGWDVLTATAGASAVEVLRANRPTLLVAVMRLPDRGEAELLKSAAAAGVPVIALTTAPKHQHPAVPSDSVNVVLRKPCSPDEIVAAIRAVLAADVDGG